MLALLAQIGIWYVTSAVGLSALVLFFQFLNILIEQRMDPVVNVSDAVAAYDKARARAMDLLRSWLSEREAQQLDAHNCFLVKGSDGGDYVLYYGINWNVRALGANHRSKETLCFQPKVDPLYEGDVLLAQKLLLESNEEAAWKVANKSTCIDERDYSFLFGEVKKPAVPFEPLAPRVYRGQRCEPLLTDPLDY